MRPERAGQSVVPEYSIALYPPAATSVYVRTTPEFEAPSNSAYAWLNKATFVGTVTYMSPERIHGKSYNTPSDIFGLGIVVILTGHVPL